MSDRISPPSWTEWTRNPSERSPQRKTFDDMLGDLRKEGLIEVKGSLFVHLAKYSYIHIKNARIDVAGFLKSVPEAIFGPVPPAYRVREAEAMFKILVASGFATILEESGGFLVTVLLTERQAPGEVAKGQVLHTVLSHLRQVLGKWDPVDLVSRASSFPTVESVAKATGVDRAHLSPGDGAVVVADKPESNEANATPFLQDTIDAQHGPLVLLQFWPLPDQRGSAAGPDPEFTLVIPGDLPLATLVRENSLPVLGEFFRSTDHQTLGAEIQAKYASYMRKYREKFTASAGLPANDRIDKVLTTADPDGEAFANAVYVAAQVLKSVGRDPKESQKSSYNLVVYQAARIAYASAMAQRVKKRKTEKDAAARTQDSALLVKRLQESTRPLTIDELKRTGDSTKNKEIGAKYPSVIELLPLTSPPGAARPAVYEVGNGFVHRENLIKSFLDLREREAIAQRERLAQQWAREGIPPMEEMFLLDREVSTDFLKIYETMLQERVLATDLQAFLKDFLPSERDLMTLARWVWPEGHKGGITPLEVVTRGLDPILYEDKDRLKKRSMVGVLGLQAYYQQIVKSSWNIVFMEDGLFKFVVRKILSFFGGKVAPRPEKEAPPAKGGAPATSGGPAKGAAGSGSGGAPEADPRAKKAADLKKLKSLAPALASRDNLINDREKLASQWVLKLDGEAARKTRQVVDDEIARIALKIPIEQLSEENSAAVALFLIEKSPTLGQVTSSRYFNRYLYLTALLRKADALSR